MQKPLKHFKNMQTEIWRPIDGYEGYAVSNLGRVKSFNYNHTGNEKIMKPQNNGNGYLRVELWKDGKQKFFLVHRLVAAAFIPKPMGLFEINHRDENKTNNVVSNLEWVSRWDNMHYGTRTERTSKTVEASRFSDFREICLRFVSTQEAGRNGYNSGAVSSCCRGCYSTHKGNFYKNLYWRFAV